MDTLDAQHYKICPYCVLLDGETALGHLLLVSVFCPIRGSWGGPVSSKRVDQVKEGN